MMELEGPNAGDFFIGAFNLKSLELEPKTWAKEKSKGDNEEKSNIPYHYGLPVPYLALL